ncbi:MAG TPA: hypothetical protein PLX25_06215 [Sphaerochaeta sp.]|nr:hypothetical protein [Sphaerochaeta sp.]
MKRTLSILVILVTLMSPALARPASFAVGAQLGFASTGVVADMELGPVALDIGANFPAGIAYIKTLAGGDDWGLTDSLFTMTTDLTYPISLGEDFSLKVGLGNTLFTNFSESVLGFAGVAVKGEYWIKGGPFGLFAKIDLPVFLYAIGETTTESGFSYGLPLVGIFTSSIGVLYAL